MDEDEKFKIETTSIAKNFLPSYHEIKFSHPGTSVLDHQRTCLAVKYLTAKSK